jgi:putative transposase
LDRFLAHLHSATAMVVNDLDGTAGRQVWHNDWETRLTYERSYLARLNYVHQNPVKHRLVPVASHYRWCSAGWFERTASPAQVKTIYRFKTDRLRVFDDYEVLPAIDLM